MRKFSSILAITPKTNPLDFQYGTDCFGPKVENRKLKDIRQSLMEPNCDGPETVYAIAMNVGKKKHIKQLRNQHLLYGLVTYASGQLGKEPVRSQGHIHKKSAYANNCSTPEVYQIWEGKAVIYMQEYANDNPGKCYAVYAEPGDVVIVPPSWAHATISADSKTPLTFGAWCNWDYGFEYKQVREHKGLAWFPLISDDGTLLWHSNPLYKKSKLIKKKPNDYGLFGIKHGECIYKQYENNPNLFTFVPKPELKKDLWDNFTP